MRTVLALTLTAALLAGCSDAPVDDPDDLVWTVLDPPSGEVSDVAVLDGAVVAIADGAVMEHRDGEWTADGLPELPPEGTGDMVRHGNGLVLLSATDDEATVYERDASGRWSDGYEIGLDGYPDDVAEALYVWKAVSLGERLALVRVDMSLGADLYVGDTADGFEHVRADLDAFEDAGMSLVMETDDGFVTAGGVYLFPTAAATDVDPRPLLDAMPTGQALNTITATPDGVNVTSRDPAGTESSLCLSDDGPTASDEPGIATLGTVHDGTMFHVGTGAYPPVLAPPAVRVSVDGCEWTTLAAGGAPMDLPMNVDTDGTTIAVTGRGVDGMTLLVAELP